MGICAAACTLNPPSWATVCARQKRTGGIPYLVIFACDVEFTLITDLTEWCTKITAGQIGLSPPIVGDKPVTTFTKKRTDSCSPERPTAGLKVINFTSLDVDNTATGLPATQFKDVDFWNNLVANQERYLGGYFDCEGRFYGIIEDIAIEASLMHEDSNQGNQMWQGNMSWNALLEIKPIYVAGLLKALQGGCPP